MGGVRNLSSGLHRETGRSGVRASRISKKDTTNEPKRSRVSARAARAATTRKKISHAPLAVTEFNSVWDALGISAEEAANLEVRSELMLQIRKILKDSGWSQATAAKHCGVSQPRINDLLRGKINKFSIDALVNMAGALGRRVNFHLEAA